MNLQQMRDLVRTQLDLDDSDLPDPLLDAFLQEGYDRVIGLEQRWPFFASTWTITVDDNGDGIIPIDTGVIELLTTNDGRVMRYVDVRWAIGMFGIGDNMPQGTPAYWGVLNRRIKTWPAPSTTSTMSALGFRGGADWIALGASSECDADRRLHIPICWYAASLGYAQQEDEVLESTYLNRYRESATMARDTIMRTWSGQPKQVAYTHYPRTHVGPTVSLNTTGL